MTAEQVRAVLHERLERWGAILERQLAPPVVLLGLEHPPEAGQLVITTVDDLPSETIAQLLEGAAAMIRGGLGWRE